MKEQVIVTSDDVHFRETGERVPADTTVTIGLNGEWRELDLTGDHNDELMVAFGRWWRAGHKVPAPARAAATRVSQDPDRKHFLKGLRAWADKEGKSEVYKSPSGSYYHPLWLRADYCRATGVTDPDYPDGFPHKAIVRAEVETR